MAVKKNLTRLGLGLAALVTGLWIWRCFCLFPSHGWNEIRLIPAFMWAHGVSPYTPASGGLVTTWIYGPLPFLIQLPSTLAHSASQALLAAGAINIGLTLTAIATVCWGWPVPGGCASSARLLAFLITLAIWPVTSFEFFQADNVGIVLGLWSLLFLETSGGTRAGLWAAALACAAALLCKQTFLGLAAAQTCFVAFRYGWRPARDYGIRIVTLTTLLYTFAALIFGPAQFYFAVVTLPARQPWAPSIFARISDYKLHLLVHLGLPALVLGLAGRRLWQRQSPWLLVVLAYLFSWPLDLLSFLKNGGSLNSLHALLLFLPSACVIAWSEWRVLRERPVIAASLVIVIGGLRLSSLPPQTLSPHLEHLQQANLLAQSRPREIYFPWHPVVTYYLEQRFYHSEDGLFIRHLAGFPIWNEAIRSYFPERLHVVAYLKGEIDWSITRRLIIPPGTAVQDFYQWDVYAWPPQTRASPK